MSLNACAQRVAQSDPDRFASLMAAPLEARERLLPLYAFNAEIARIPWLTEHPLIAEMRLQWWRDVIAAHRPPEHEIAGPLHALIRSGAVPRGPLEALIGARRHDIYKEPFTDDAARNAYLEGSGAGLMWAAAVACGAPPDSETDVRRYGWACALAQYLAAASRLNARGHPALSGLSTQVIAALAARGTRTLDEVAGALPRTARPALLAGWQARGLLAQAHRSPHRVHEGILKLSEFYSRGSLLWLAITKGIPR